MDDRTSLLALEAALSRFFEGDLSPTQLQTQFLDELGPPHGTPTREPTAQLWHAVITNLAFYHYCDFDRPVLDESLRCLIESVRATGRATLTPITSSPCFIDAIKSRALPAPLDPRDFIAHRVPAVSRDTEEPCEECNEESAV